MKEWSAKNLESMFEGENKKHIEKEIKICNFRERKREVDRGKKKIIGCNS